MTKPEKAPAKVLFTWLFLIKLLLNWGYVHLVTLLFPSFLVCYMCVAFVQVYLVRLPVPVHKQLVSHCVHLFIHDHTQEPSIVPHFSCRMGVVVVCKWLYTFVWKKHDHSQGTSLIDCIYHLVLEGRVWLYITCICMV